MLKKVYLRAKTYLIIGLLAGIYYRELTKYLDFSGKTQLAGLHTHTLVLGMFMMLILMLFIKSFKIDKDQKFMKFLRIYDVGLLITISMMAIRGTVQVMDITISSAVNASISGFSGIGHIIIGVGFLYFFGILKRAIEK